MTGEQLTRRITGYHPDDDGQWVAELECGHTQHVRHDPPWQVREWRQTAEGRAEHWGRCSTVRIVANGQNERNRSGGFSRARHLRRETVW